MVQDTSIIIAIIWQGETKNQYGSFQPTACSELALKHLFSGQTCGNNHHSSSVSQVAAAQKAAETVEEAAAQKAPAVPFEEESKKDEKPKGCCRHQSS